MSDTLLGHPMYLFTLVKYTALPKVFLKQTQSLYSLKSLHKSTQTYSPEIIQSGTTAGKTGKIFNEKFCT